MSDTPLPQQPKLALPRWLILVMVVSTAYWLYHLFDDSSETTSSAPYAHVDYGEKPQDITGLYGNPAEKLTPPPTTVNTTESVSTPVEPYSPWNYSEQEDTMRGGKDYYASTISTNVLHFDFPYEGETRGTLTLRNSKQLGKDVILEISQGQFSCSIDECATSVKFDDSPVLHYSWSRAADGSPEFIFVDNYKGFVSRLKKAKKLVIETQYYRAGVQQLEFNVENLEWK